MKKNKIYLATLEDGVKLNKEVKDYLADLEIVIEKEYKQTGVLKLNVPPEIDVTSLKYIEHIEPDKEVFGF